MKCGNCGDEGALEGKFCVKCGAKPDGSGSSESAGKSSVIEKSQVWSYLKWGTLAVGFLLIIFAFTRDTSMQASPIVALGCFFGIVSRILQAEEHHQWERTEIEEV